MLTAPTPDLAQNSASLTEPCSAEPAKEFVLSLRNVSKRFGSVSVLRGLDLSIERGQIHGLVGLNGSGKTTTLDCILGLQRADTGEIRALGLSPSDLYRAQGGVVAVFDSPSLHPHLTVRQALRHAETLCAAPARSVDEVMALLGLERYSGFSVRKLSLGNRRRVSIAHALLGNPQLVLLDEPFNGLDAGGVDEVLALITKLNSELGVSFLLSSHQLPYLQSICTHLSILHRGEIAASGTLRELLSDTRTVLRIETQQIEDALMLLEKRSDVETERTDELGTNVLRLRLDGATPAEINKALVTAGIAVDGLTPERASIDTLFRRIVSETASSTGSAK